MGLIAGVAGRSQTAPPDRGQQGLAARQIAAELVRDALSGRRTLDASLDVEHGHGVLSKLATRDRAFVKLLATETLRRYGQIREALGRFMTRKPPRSAGLLEPILAISACQILFLDTPGHAAVDQAVRLAEGDRGARRYKGLANAVLRRLAEARATILAEQDPAALNTPDWLARRWIGTFGAGTAQAIAEAHLSPPPLDLTVKDDAGAWAQRLGGTVLATGSVRLVDAGDVTRLAGFEEGAWWVQDAASTLPARLLGDVRGLRVVDLCAAPGGKTAQLAADGALVTAVERSPVRLKRLAANLTRLGLDAELVEADAAAWRIDTSFEAALLDAPCSATGTLRRHPDIAWARSPADITALAELQARLLDAALKLVKPGGLIVYATCSLEPEEGEGQVHRVVGDGRAERVPIAAWEVGGLEACVTAHGDFRTLPCHDPGTPGGMDGFFAARLKRTR